MPRYCCLPDHQRTSLLESFSVFTYPPIHVKSQETVKNSTFCANIFGEGRKIQRSSKNKSTAKKIRLSLHFCSAFISFNFPFWEKVFCFRHGKRLHAFPLPLDKKMVGIKFTQVCNSQGFIKCFTFHIDTILGQSSQKIKINTVLDALDCF